LAIPEGAVFKSFKDPVIDNGGLVAFIATIAGKGVTAANDTVVVSNGRTGELEVIAREGTPAPGTNGDEVQVSSMGCRPVYRREQSSSFHRSSSSGEPSSPRDSPVFDRTKTSARGGYHPAARGPTLLVREGGPGFSARGDHQGLYPARCDTLVRPGRAAARSMRTKHCFNSA
jgi:hypothetical protein